MKCKILGKKIDRSKYSDKIAARRLATDEFWEIVRSMLEHWDKVKSNPGYDKHDLMVMPASIGRAADDLWNTLGKPSVQEEEQVFIASYAGLPIYLTSKNEEDEK